jgi:hypothetical protein
MMRRIRRAAWGLALVAFCSGTAGAQSTTTSFEELAQTLTRYDTVTVTDNTGRRMKGDVEQITASSLVIRGSSTGDLRTFSRDAVTKIERPDSLLNGTLIGSGIGALGLVAFVRGNCLRNDPECDAIVGTIGLSFVAAGAVIGALIDKAIVTVIYRAPATGRTAHVLVTPIVSKQRAAVVVTVPLARAPSPGR